MKSFREILTKAYATLFNKYKNGSGNNLLGSLKGVLIIGS